jgi:hypothetical protein
LPIASCTSTCQRYAAPALPLWRSDKHPLRKRQPATSRFSPENGDKRDDVREAGRVQRLL